MIKAILHGEYHVPGIRRNKDNVLKRVERKRGGGGGWKGGEAKEAREGRRGEVVKEDKVMGK